MRLVFVNHYHPDAPHIGAARLREFARAMAGRGHQVVLLTESLGGPATPGDLATRLEGHDWSAPLVVACDPRPSPLLAALRQGRLPRPVRATVIAGLYLVHGGVFPDWLAGLRPAIKILADPFRPQACWATFGNTEAWLIARAIARRAGCPWVMDVKDAWDAFLPAPLRVPVARRFADAAALTGLSEAYLAHTGRRFPIPATVVRSGFPRTLLGRVETGPAAARVVLTGSLYADATVAGLMRGLRLWLETLAPDERPCVTLTYAGTETERLAAAVQGLGCRLDLRGFVALEDLTALQREAFINLYACVGVPDRFHHKLFELLAAGRPIACFPAEGPEALDLAARVEGRLASCSDPGQLAQALAAAWAARDQGASIDGRALETFSWEGQAEILERVLAEAACA